MPVVAIFFHNRNVSFELDKCMIRNQGIPIPRRGEKKLRVVGYWLLVYLIPDYHFNPEMMLVTMDESSAIFSFEENAKHEWMITST